MVVALLLVTSSVTAGLAAAGPAAGPADDRTGPAGVSADPAATNGSAVNLTLAAADAVDATGAPQEERALERLNGTLAWFVDGNRVTRAATFDEHRKVAATFQNRADEVSALLAAADHAVANASVRDAERVRDRLLARNVSFDESAVESAVASAESSLETADTHREQGRPVAAISHYRSAWESAQSALDAMAADAAPQVNITTRMDPPHNDTISYELRGTVFAVRPRLVETVTVSHDGTNRTVPVDPETVPGTPAAFDATLNLTDRVNEVTVTVADPVADAGTGDGAPGNGNGPPGNGDGPPGNGDDRDGGATPADDATLKLDGDGLPDRYEVAVTGTDPLDPDSDAAATDADEADDGVIDGAEDLDGDLVNYQEYRFGTDPLVADTDGDGLRDSFEVRTPSLDPLAADTNDDGVGDGEDDPDGDGLTTAEEQDAGTDPFVPDTDGEGLDDGAELDEYGTNATLADTDGDGLDDAQEVELGTDPLVADSDGDGVADANETFTTETSSPSLGATVSVTGEGDVADDVAVDRPDSVALSREYGPNATVSRFVSFETNRSFESAEITLSYDESAVSTNESAVAVYRFDAANGTFQRLNSTVDAANDTVTATTGHFSTYVAFDAPAWNAFLDGVTRFGDPEDLPAAGGDFVDVQNVDPGNYTDVSVYASVDTPEGEAGNLTAEDFTVYEARQEMPVKSVEYSEGSSVDVVFVFDDSGSMANEISSMKANSEEFVDGLEAEGLDARYALVSFRDGNHVDQPFTGDADEFQDAVDSLYAWGGGDYPEDSLDAIHAGTQLDFREDAQKVVVHITDAASHDEDRTSNTVDDLEETMREQGVSYYTVSPSGTRTVDLADRVGGLWIDIADVRGAGGYAVESAGQDDGTVRNNSVAPANESDAAGPDASAADGPSATDVAGETDSFDAFLEDLQGRLTDRYEITFESCLPVTDTGRRVDVYAASGGALATDVGGYTPPSDADPSYGETCDPDGDGIPTQMEENGIPLFPGLSTVETDPNASDTDGDGLADGEEVDVDDPVVVDLPTGGELFLGYNWTADPTDPNTDDVGLDDAEELAKANPSEPKVPEVLWVSLGMPTLTRDLDDDGEPDPVTVNRAGDPDASADPICAWNPDRDSGGLTCQGGSTDTTLAATYQDNWAASFGCPGPLCFGDGPPDWIPEDAKSGKVYFLLRSSVQAKARNVDVDGLSYSVQRQDGLPPKGPVTQMTFLSGGDMEGPVEEDGRQLEFAFRLPNDDPGSLGQLSYRDLGTYSVRVEGLEDTALARPGGDGTASSPEFRYAGYTDPAFAVSQALVDDARTVFEKGMQVASLTQTGLVTFRATGSLAAAGKDVVKSYLWGEIEGAISPVPTSPEGATTEAMAIFEEGIEQYRTNGPKKQYAYGDISYAQIVVIRAS